MSCIMLLVQHCSDNLSLSVYVCAVFACSTEAQTHLVRATSAIERAGFVTMHWVSNVNSSTQSVSQTVEELKTEVKNTGGYFQLLIQVHGKSLGALTHE